MTPYELWLLELRKQEAARVAALNKKYPYWGWGPHEGLRCQFNNNTGCNTYWKDGKLYEKK
jgi:hypothetical protein